MNIDSSTNGNTSQYCQYQHLGIYITSQIPNITVRDWVIMPFFIHKARLPGTKLELQRPSNEESMKRYPFLFFVTEPPLLIGKAVCGLQPRSSNQQCLLLPARVHRGFPLFIRLRSAVTCEITSLFHAQVRFKPAFASLLFLTWRDYDSNLNAVLYSDCLGEFFWPLLACMEMMRTSTCTGTSPKIFRSLR